MKNKKLYSKYWHDIIRPEILKRDNYKCTELGCNVRHKAVGYYNLTGQWVECDSFMSNWATTNGFKVQCISLQVIHIDQNPANNDHSNLLSKCPKHHFKFDLAYNQIKRVMQKKKP